MDYTNAQLRDLLREKGLSVIGNKIDLIARLRENVPDIFNNEIQRSEEEIFSNIQEEVEDDFNSHQETIYEKNQEFRLMQQERDFLRREVDLLKREAELRNRDLTVRNSNVVGRIDNIKMLKDLLNEFDGTTGDFLKWEQQIELIREMYNLEDNTVRLLISSKLKGKAMNWFHSKPEHIRLSATDLLREIKEMFDQRPSKLMLRKEFENRLWRGDETFNEYCHDKVILANNVPIDTSEIVDYIIDGITDLQLQDQARLQCFKSIVEIRRAFEKVTLKSRIKNERTGKEMFRSKEVIQNTKKVDGKFEGYSEVKSTFPRRGIMRCYNCQEEGHRAADCKNDCKKLQVIVEKGIGKTNNQLKNELKKTSTASNELSLIQHSADVKPYEVSAHYVALDEEGNKHEYCIQAIVDTGSPISLIKFEYVPKNCYYPIENDYQYKGINGSKITLLGIFEKDIVINNIVIYVKFFIVSNSTMSFAALLGRDFVSNSAIKIEFNEIMKISRNKSISLEEDNHIKQILQIDSSVLGKDEIDLNIELNVKNEIKEKLKEIYIKSYLENKESTLLNCKSEMFISLKHEQPITFRPRRLAYADRVKLRTILDNLIKEGIIRESSSPYASPIVLVRKKNGDMRLCIDYRELNKITIKDNFPTPLIEDHLDRLRNKKIFSSLDLKNGFHHIQMAESSIKYTAFVTPIGQYEYLKMPFGLTNAPRVFQRYIYNIFKPLIDKGKILIYMDDILIATEEIEEHLNIIHEVFEIARQHKLQFQFKKCFFLQNQITFLGYCIDQNGIQPSALNIESMINYPIPRNTKEVQRFIGLASYFRKFIPKFSILAKPLYDLLRKNVIFKFGVDENKAFETLKQHLSNKPTLAIYSPTAYTELHCDASTSGFGAILLQKQDDGFLRPVSYFSHRTSVAESHYHSFELECLAVVYALKRFHIYLSGIKFKIITDCDSFRLTLNKQTINPRIARWAMFLQQYDYEILHRPGKRMIHVDALSRCHSVLILEGNTFEQILSIKQNQDKKICEIRDKLEKVEDKFYELRNGLVYRKINKHKLLFYVPESMEENIIRSCHDDLGHLGIKKVIESINKVYWFPEMQEKVKNYIRNCLKCIEFSPFSGKMEGYLHIVPKGNLPFQIYHIDHYGPLQKTSKGFKYILGIIDGFTKFLRLFPCKSTNSSESIKHLKEYFQNYSKPRCIVSDRGTSFTSEEFKNFLKKESVDHQLIAVGTPRANGQIERLNRVLTPMIAKLCDDQKKWDQILYLVEYAINNTVSRSTGYTPSQLLFGVDQLGKVNDVLRLVLENQFEKKRDLCKKREIASKNIIESQIKNKRLYDSKHKKATIYNKGDYVVIVNVDTTPGINKKFIPKFKGPYIVQKVLGSDRYVVTDIPGFQLTQLPYNGVVSADRMRLWKCN